MTKDGRVWGSYLHGIFDNEDLVFALVQDIMKEKGINPAENHLSIAEYKEIQYNKLADLIRNSRIWMQFIKYYLERRKRWFVALEKKMILLEKA